MTNKEIREIALRQSAIDCNCDPDDFYAQQNIVTISNAHPKARRYLPLPLECDLVSYGNNIVAQVSERTKDQLPISTASTSASVNTAIPGHRAHRRRAVL